MSVVMETLRKIQAAESFIPEFSERMREDRIRAAALAKHKLEVQKTLRAQNPQLTEAEFRKNWVAFCAITQVI